MGNDCVDRFSWLHFATGMIFYYWDVDFWLAFLIHIVFEVIENTDTGIDFINKYVKLWPGGKPTRDSFLNSMVCDNAFFLFGYLAGYLLDKYEHVYRW